MKIKKYLSQNIFGLYIFKALTLIRLSYQKLTSSNSTIFFYYNQTKILIENELSFSSNCIDLGASKGDILDVIIKTCPEGQHIAVEPIPIFFKFLQHFYKLKNVTIINAITLDFDGLSPFYFQSNEPAISGVTEVNKQLNSVKTLYLPVVKLDSIINKKMSCDLIKIDCIGSELSIIKGAISVLNRSHPIIIFDFIEAHYTKLMAEELYEILTSLGYSIFPLSEYPDASKLNLTEFITIVFEKKQSHFFAFSKASKKNKH